MSDNIIINLHNPRLSFVYDGKMVVCLYVDGHVEYGEGYTLHDGTAAFWAALTDVGVEQIQQFYEKMRQLKSQPEDPVSAYDRAMKLLGKT